MLSSQGIESYEEQVTLYLLDFAYRYTANVLQDAQVYAMHARGGGSGGPTGINADDVRTAVASRVNHSFRGPPPKEFLLELAAERNRKPLPPVHQQFGLRLPPEKYCLTGDLE